MDCLSLSWQYQLFCLLSLLFHSPFSFSSSLSSNSPCSALLQFSNSLSLHSFASPSLHASVIPIHSYDYRSNFHMCDNSYPKIVSWKKDKDCCSWDGVKCDDTTLLVSGLDLSCSWLSSSIPSNSSLFLLYHLRSLNLAGNNFNYSLISFEFGSYKMLTPLNLSYSFFLAKSHDG